MKRVDRAWLKEHNACPDGFKYWCEHCEGQDTDQQLLILVKDHDDWAWWMLTRLLTIEQNRQLAVFAAKEVLPIFEKKFPEDQRPRKAIEAAEKVIGCDIEENRAAARDAAWAAGAAARDADARAAAAWAAAAADWAAAAWAAWAARDAWAAGTTSAMKMKILRYGISLLNKGLPR